jgi:hypothetical protein
MNSHYDSAPFPLRSALFFVSGRYASQLPVDLAQQFNSKQAIREEI